MEWGILCLVIVATNAHLSKADSTLPDEIISSPEPDWPQWRGPRRDGIVDAEGLLPSWPQGGPTLLWKTDGIGTGWSSPIVVNGRVFVTGDVGNDLVVSAFDCNARPRWHSTNGRAWTGSYPGARASCTFSDGRLYHLNAHGRLACLDPATGSENWSLNILDRFGGDNITWALSESVLVDGNRVVVTPGGSQALMAALDKRNGQTIWTTEPLGEDRASHSSPLLFRHAGRRVIANCSSAHGFGVDADSGQLLWTVPLKNRFGVNASSPVFSDESVFFVTPYAEEGRLYRLKASGESVVPKHVWSSPLDTVTGCAVLLGDTLFAAGYRKDKWWFGVDWATGENKCELKDFTTGAAVYADNRLYCFDERGQVGLLNATAGSLDVTGQFQLIADRVRDAWAHPVVHDGRLYLRYHDSLWCYDVRVHQ
jgi:outer membrane protein assembly factor BamB